MPSALRLRNLKRPEENKTKKIRGFENKVLTFISNSRHCMWSWIQRNTDCIRLWSTSVSLWETDLVEWKVKKTTDAYIIWVVVVLHAIRGKQSSRVYPRKQLFVNNKGLIMQVKPRTQSHRVLLCIYSHPIHPASPRQPLLDPRGTTTPTRLICFSELYVFSTCTFRDSIFC